MTVTSSDTDFYESARREEKAARRVLLTISFCHMLNDMMQSLILAIYPMLKASFSLSFGQIGFITLTFQITASLLQPLIGMYTDRSPKNFSLSVGMTFTLVGLLLLALANSYPMVLVAAAMVGMGSSVFHPESSRIARLASGGRHGFAQSVFQVGGNVGSAIGPLVAAYAIAPHGQSSVGWFSLVALLAVILLATVGQWYKAHRASRSKLPAPAVVNSLARSKVALAIAILLSLLFSKYFYMASISSYYTFYLIDRFGVTTQDAQVYLFIFLGSAALGTILGGPIGDRIGRKRVIWGSILGVLPFSLILPHVSLVWTIILTIPIGLILSSAFAAIVVYGQELIPGKVGMVAGLFFGFAFGMGGIGAAVLGNLADATSITFVYELCAFLPVLGLLAVLLPNVDSRLRT